MKVYEKFSALLPCVQNVYLRLSAIPSREVVVDIDDTLIFDDGRSTPNVQVKELIAALLAKQYKVHLVTARLHDADMVRATKQELKKLGIEYTSLKLAPAKAREDSASISEWKALQRKAHAPVALTVGDQWSDIVRLESDDDLVKLDYTHGVHKTPWILVDPEDGVTSLGFKLMA
jgi:hypothetical protein